LEKNKKEEEEGGRKGGGYLRQHLAVASLTEQEKKRLYKYIQQGGRGGPGPFLPHCQTSLPSLGLRAALHDALSDQVPVEVIRDLLVGARRGNRWPRDHMVCWAIVSC